jgi:hypothetical protein
MELVTFLSVETESLNHLRISPVNFGSRIVPILEQKLTWLFYTVHILPYRYTMKTFMDSGVKLHAFLTSEFNENGRLTSPFGRFDPQVLPYLLDMIVVMHQSGCGGDKVRLSPALNFSSTP